MTPEVTGIEQKTGKTVKVKVKGDIKYLGPTGSFCSMSDHATQHSIWTTDYEAFNQINPFLLIQTKILPDEDGQVVDARTEPSQIVSEPIALEPPYLPLMAGYTSKLKTTSKNTL